jgi:flagellar protein FliO/FliZ
MSNLQTLLTRQTQTTGRVAIRPGFHAYCRGVGQYAQSCLATVLLLPLLADAQTTRPAYTPPPDAVSTGSLLQVIFSLLLVLAAVVLVAWIVKRINLPQQGAGSLIKVISGVAVGQRERIVLVEVKDTWLVVGVAPGQVRTLHSMPKAELPAAQGEAAPESDGKFQVWLKQMVEKRNAG